jgi:hypothetical protein
LCWTTLSTRRLAAELSSAGHRVGADTVARLLNRPGFARGWGSGHLALLGDCVSIHDFTFNRCHVVD